MHNPTVLQVIPHLETGGAELSTLEMVEALVSVGAKALVATQGGRMAAELERLGGEIIPLPAASKNPRQIYLNAKKLQELIKKRDIKLIHARSRAPAWSALLAAHKSKIPLVTTYHGAYGEKEPFKRFYNSVMARGDMVIANSKYTADLVRGRHLNNLGEDNLKIIYRGVDLKRFCRANIEQDRLDRLRSDWGIEQGQKIILHPARLTGWKGQGVVIDAAGILLKSKEMADTVFILAGDHQGREEYLDRLKRQIEHHGLKDRVRLVGHCADMAAAYALADVTLIASIEPEAFGRTSAEAQALGCPVIATNIGAPPETVRSQPAFKDDETTGWLVPPESPDDLAAAMKDVLLMACEDYQAMSQRAIINVTQNFSDYLMKVRTLAVYDRLLGMDFATQYEDKYG